MATTTASSTEFIYLKKVYDENEIVYVARPDMFEVCNYADTYGKYGQMIGHEDAGDHHPDNQYIDFEDGDEEVLTQCTAYTYFDGSNWASIVIACDSPDEAITHEVVTDETEIATYVKAIEDKEFLKDGFGKKIYQYDDLFIIDSYAQGSWETLRIINEDSYLMENQ